MLLQNVKLFAISQFTKSERLALYFASLGGFLEMYDFAIYCFYSLYFSHKIFAVTILPPIVYVFLIFTLGISTKILGIYAYQKIGYKVPLNYLLSISLFLTTLGFLIIACIPTYRYAGIYAGFILLVTRIIQGIGFGVEWQGVIKFLSINLSAIKRRYALVAILLGMELGLLAGITINRALVIWLNDYHLEMWGWRTPFFLGALLSLVFFTIRTKTNKFEDLARKYSYHINLITMFYRYRKYILLYSGVLGILSTLLVNGIIFMPIYLHDLLNINYHSIGRIIFNAAILSVAVSFICNLLVSRINPIWMLKLILLSMVVAVVSAYHTFSTGEHIEFGIYLLVSYYGLLMVTIPKVIKFEFLPTYARLTTTLIVIHIGIIFLGGLNPLIISIMIKYTRGFFLAPCIYTICMITLSYYCLEKLISIQQNNTNLTN